MTTLNQTLSASSILSDIEIVETFFSENGEGLIQPFTSYIVRNGLSYGLGSYGYDIRLSDELYVFKDRDKSVTELIDPKRFNKNCLELAPLHHTQDRGKFFIIPANSFALGVAEEYIEMPPDVTGICLGKSTYARCAINVPITPVEAGWKGHLTLEICNNTPADACVYAHEGIAQIVFFRGNPCRNTYENRSGKYQSQEKKVVFSKVD